MYLARTASPVGPLFSLRESYLHHSQYKSRELVRLGGNPARFIHYLDSVNFTVDDWVFSQLLEAGREADPFELEQIFFPYLDPDVKTRLNSFMDRSKNRQWKPMAGSEKKRINNATHLFDRRRIHFLRFGGTDQMDLDRAAPLYQVLMEKSRDEIEQLILAREQQLRPHEYKRYIFAVFDLQRFFRESYARTMPDALDADKLDGFFLCELCGLDLDAGFWAGFDRSSPLPEYLQRYLFMYFDWSTQDGLGWDTYIRAFNRSRLRGSGGGPPQRGHRMSLDELATAFGVSRQRVQELDRKGLTRLYRTRALDLHPDRGGDHDRFVALASAYAELRRIKGW